MPELQLKLEEIKSPRAEDLKTSGYEDLKSPKNIQFMSLKEQGINIGKMMADVKKSRLKIHEQIVVKKHLEHLKLNKKASFDSKNKNFKLPNSMRFGIIDSSITKSDFSDRFF
jgi:hypothetical protein